MAFSPPVVGCLVKKCLQKGGSRAPQDPPGYALVLITSPKETLKETDRHSSKPLCCVEQWGGETKKITAQEVSGVTRAKASFTKKPA